MPGHGGRRGVSSLRHAACAAPTWRATPPPPAACAQQAGGAWRSQALPDSRAGHRRRASQKQVALLHQPRVEVRPSTGSVSIRADQWVRLRPRGFLITRNRREEELGLPLPAGGWPVRTRRTPHAVGEACSRPRSGEDVEIEFGPAPGVIAALASPTKHDGLSPHRHQRPAAPVRSRPSSSARRRHASAAPGSRRNGLPLWAVTVPANGSATLRYRLTGCEGCAARRFSLLLRSPAPAAAPDHRHLAGPGSCRGHRLSRPLSQPPSSSRTSPG